MLKEGERSLASLSAVGRHSDSRRRLNGIHHLLLVTAQAQSLHRNYLARHNVKKESGEEIALSLDRLADALARTSSVLLGLIPQIEIEPAAESPEIHPVKITVTLLNVGSQSVDMVKLGLDSTALPARCPLHPDRTRLTSATCGPVKAFRQRSNGTPLEITRLQRPVFGPTFPILRPRVRPICARRHGDKKLPRFNRPAPAGQKG